MQPEDRFDIIRRYSERLRDFGETPEALGWGPNGRQDVRFGVLAGLALQNHTSSVLDVGCGFADLYSFLVQRRWSGRYTGLDLVPDVLDRARRRCPGLDLRQADLTDGHPVLDSYDYVIGSGVFNGRLKNGDNREHTRELLASMHRLTRVAVCVDFLSTLVDFQKPAAWHTDPAEALRIGRSLSRRVMLRMDYMPYEFALFIFKDDCISPRNVFQAVDDATA